MEVTKETWPFFRFKTLEEFGGKRPFFWNSTGGMDYLFGKPCKEIRLDRASDDGMRFSIQGRWVVRVENLTLMSTVEEIE